MMQKAEKLLKPWHIDTRLRVLLTHQMSHTYMLYDYDGLILYKYIKQKRPGTGF